MHFDHGGTVAKKVTNCVNVIHTIYIISEFMRFTLIERDTRKKVENVIDEVYTL